MKGYLPGTRIESRSLDPNEAEFIFNSIFSMGGLVLSQVSRLSGVEYYTVQNWIKRGFCAPPVAKKYSRRQFSRIIIINMLKDALEIQDITETLSSLNGRLDTESDDTIDDSLLYVCFISVLNSLGVASIDTTGVGFASISTIDDAIRQAADVEAARCAVQCGVNREKLSRVLQIMVNAYLGVYFKTQAKLMIRSGD